jgi:hypothetical protein
MNIMSIDDINIEHGTTYETLVTTLNPGNQPNAAAVGVRRVDGKLRLKVFEGSNTFENLRNVDTFGINILETDQYDLAIKAALKGWGDAEPEFESSKYEYDNNIPFLKAAKSWIVCNIETSSIQELTDEYGKTQVMEIVAEVQDLILREKIETPLTRSPDLPILEAAILATRYKVTEGEVRQRIKTQIDDILKEIDNKNELVDLLSNFLNKWKL